MKLYFTDHVPPSRFPCLTDSRTYTGCIGFRDCAAWQNANPTALSDDVISCWNGEVLGERQPAEVAA